LATINTEKVWIVLKCRDIRDIIKVAKLANSREDISRIIEIMNRYFKSDKRQFLDVE